MLGAPELDLATADAIAGEVGRASKHALPIGTPCPNCTTPLQGPWCHTCGQKGEKYDRSIWHLAAEAFEGLTHFDGRFWHTVPRLVYRPGQLTRDFLDGHRASQIPPFRLFLVVLLLVFFTGGLSFGHNNTHVNVAKPKDPGLHAVVTASGLNAAEVIADPKKAAEAIDKNADMDADDKADAKEALSQLAKVRQGNSSNPYWQERADNAVRNPEAYVRALEEWGHRFAILMLPISALLLTAIFVFKRGVYVFDHLIFSMHSLSFQGLLLTAIFLGSMLTGWVWWLLWAAPVHLFFHMRRTYGISTFGTLARMWLLFWGSVIAVSALLVCLLIVSAMAAH